MIMADACFVTSVPSAAHRDADVRSFDRWGVVDAITGHRNDGVIRFPAGRCCVCVRR
jgi:hypothetical protein